MGIVTPERPVSMLSQGTVMLRDPVTYFEHQA